MQAGMHYLCLNKEVDPAVRLINIRSIHQVASEAVHYS